MKIICLASLLCTALTPAWSKQLTYNMYGQPGLIDMPTAQSDSDGVLALNQSYFDGTLRTTITAQTFTAPECKFSLCRAREKRQCGVRIFKPIKSPSFYNFLKQNRPNLQNFDQSLPIKTSQPPIKSYCKMSHYEKLLEMENN